MTSRPGSASLQARVAADRAASGPRTSPGGVATNAAMPGMPSKPRGPSNGSAALKNFGPPLLQSDTVVFQAAKIPLSSARSTSQPGSVVASPGHPRGAHGVPQRRDHAPEYGVPPSGYAPSPGVPLRRPRSPPSLLMRDPRESTAGQGPRASNGSMPGRHQPPHDDGRGGRDGRMMMEEQQHAAMEMNGHSRSMGPMQNKVKSQRTKRPSSADSKRSTPRRVVRLTIRVIKEGDKLGFGIRNDSNRKLKVSTLQSNSTAAKSELKIGDTILTVNGVDLTHLGFLEVIQQLKATRPGELVFDIERSLDDDEPLSGTESGSQQGETMDLDSPLSVAEKRFGPAGMAQAAMARANAGSRQPSPSRSMMDSSHSSPHGVPVTPPGMTQLPPGHHAARMNERTPPMHHQQTPPSSRDVASSSMPPPPMAVGPVTTIAEPARKRPRPSGVSSEAVVEFAKMDKQQKAAINGLSLELQKERSERMSLEEKNAALRKRLQNMLIECDEVRVKAGSTVAAIKDQAQREVMDLKQALQSAKAQLRLQDRGPDVGRTDSIISDLMSTKEQLNRLRKLEMDRATGMSNRYSLESRQADREAHRTRDRLVALFQVQLREAARRHYNNSGNAKASAGKDGRGVIVELEGLRRLAFVKLFGLPCSYEWYISDDFFSTNTMDHSLPKQDDVMDVFGNTLCHEERAGLFLIASAPMNVTYDPSNEKLTLTCSWVEQNQVRELARNFRF